MNKRQRKKQQRKHAHVLRPWAGRFSRVPDNLAEFYVIYAARPVSGSSEREVSEVVAFPYTPDADCSIQCCRDMVDSFLMEVHHAGMTAEKLYSRYRKEGPDPYIQYEERDVFGAFTSSMPFAFNAWGYAETACRRLCDEELGEQPSRLALWQGRYYDYDRKRMAAQLLLWRRVRLMRECAGAVGTFPAGTSGIIGMHAYYISASCFDWAIELPVIFDVGDERGQVTFGVPYDALEFVESDEAHMQNQKLAKPE